MPSYGESSLADLSASILASLTGDAAANVLGLPEVGRVCLLIVDGLGLELLRDHQAAAPFLAELAFNSRPLTAGFPSTTVTSLASLGTGLVPGVHGMLGYQVAIPGEGRLLNGLRWPKDVDPVAWQPQPTIYERAAAAGVSTVHVASGAFKNSGLSRATLRGTDYRAARSLGALAALAVDALSESDRVLVSVYTGHLDGCGHEFGVSSPAWVNELAHVDKLAEQIAAGLPYGSVLYVTADHGMVNVGPEDRIDADAEGSALRDGVALLGGEARMRHIYTRPGAADDVLAAWREVLGERAWVMSREEAIKDGLFGPVSEAVAARIGDVVAACVGTWAVICSKDEPLESSLEGMHGSLTPAEQLVPLLAPAPRLVGPGRLPSRYPRTVEHTGPVTDQSADVLITAPELAGLPGVTLVEPGERLETPGNITLLDVRWRLGGPPGRELYDAGHIPGAKFVDLDRDLAAPPGAGGRHPLPATADFERAMYRAGVRDGRPVVVYDDADSTAAARAWWLLRYFGHPSVRVLDGGFRAWTAGGYPVVTTSQERPVTAPGRFTARPGHLGLLDADGAASIARSGLLLDARTGERYRGEAEHVDPVAGHIPGAVSAPTAENVNEDGTFRPPSDLAARFTALGATDGRPVAAYCGSGVTAAHEVLALTLAGVPADLYVGSWSNWITDPARLVATGSSPG